jgi:hypothetical protein
MFCANIDCDITQLIGCWKSDEMLKYLHVQAAALMSNDSCQMFKDDDFTYTANQDITDPTTFPVKIPRYRQAW